MSALAEIDLEIIQLSPAELRIILAHRDMTSDAQRLAINVMESWAAMPALASRKVAEFKLITGGAA